MPTFGSGILFACFRSQIMIDSERCFFRWRFSVALLTSLAEKPEHANAPIDPWATLQDTIYFVPFIILLSCDLPLLLHLNVNIHIMQVLHFCKRKAHSVWPMFTLWKGQHIAAVLLQQSVLVVGIWVEFDTSLEGEHAICSKADRNRVMRLK